MIKILVELDLEALALKALGVLLRKGVVDLPNVFLAFLILRQKTDSFSIYNN
jgi:hypothetical protein